MTGLADAKRMIEEGAPLLGTLFVLEVIDGMPAHRAKETILFARSPGVKLITDQQAQILLRELGLIAE